eukprot:984289-Rhodomonas_salina.2
MHCWCTGTRCTEPANNGFDLGRRSSRSLRRGTRFLRRRTTSGSASAERAIQSPFRPAALRFAPHCTQREGARN